MAPNIPLYPLHFRVVQEIRELSHNLIAHTMDCIHIARQHFGIFEYLHWRFYTSPKNNVYDHPTTMISSRSFKIPTFHTAFALQSSQTSKFTGIKKRLKRPIQDWRNHPISIGVKASGKTRVPTYMKALGVCLSYTIRLYKMAKSMRKSSMKKSMR